MSYRYDQSRRAVLVSAKLALEEGLSSTLASVIASHTNGHPNSRKISGVEALGVIPADLLVVPKAVRIAPQGPQQFDPGVFPQIRIVGLSGQEWADSGIERAGLTQWPIAMYVWLGTGHILPRLDAYPTFGAEERLVLAHEAYMDAIRIAMTLDVTGVDCGWYGVYGAEMLNQRTTYFSLDHAAKEATAIMGEQIWGMRQGVRT